MKLTKEHKETIEVYLWAMIQGTINNIDSCFRGKITKKQVTKSLNNMKKMAFKNIVYIIENNG